LYHVERTEQLVDNFFRMWVRAPRLAHHTQDGQFAMSMTDETGGRIHLTISAVKEDCVCFIFKAIGKITRQFGTRKRGDSIRDRLGPFGQPSEIAKYGTCAVAEGGV
jgi:ferredoxin--NADP+ reductase